MSIKLQPIDNAAIRYHKAELCSEYLTPGYVIFDYKGQQHTKYTN